jgi:DNA topoisomerase I
MVELIVTEKPAQAQKIAEALADTKAIKKTKNAVSYYELTHNKKKILVGCAVGHLFGLAKSDNAKKGYPTFDIEWKSKADIDKGAAYTRKYINVLKSLSKKADTFTVGTDFDVEGSVIGHNVIKYICGQTDARRMKFSTLTKPELISAYEKATKHLDFPQVHAGDTRHHLDWFYGINLSNALMKSIKSATDRFRLMSTGRVQGPTLKVIVKKEEEIKRFKPETYWEIYLDGSIKKEKIEAHHRKGKFKKKTDVTAVLKKTKGKKAIIDQITKREQNVKPPTPFDLTSLQMEAYKTCRITPKDTSKLAQDLYTAGLISYPRTSSQKLPKDIGYKKILEALSKKKEFENDCKKLLLLPKLIPHEGKKKDPAHPAIYPTGEIAGLTGKGKKLYTLITRRFFAVFGEPAKKENTIVVIDVNSEKFSLSGSRIVEQGWYELYGEFAKQKEQMLPILEKGDEVKVKKIRDEEKETQPPKRYSPASIIKEMENLGIGTKSTRAMIVEALYQRKYIDGVQLAATPLGITLIHTLEKYSPDIIDEDLTKELEEDMQAIRDKKKTKKEVIEKAKKSIIKIMKDFKEHEKKIGTALGKATEGEDDFGPCPKCKKGTLKKRMGRFGPFVACDRYEEGCKTTFGIPKGCLVKATDKICEECKHPIILIIRKGKRPQELCINKECPSKKITLKLEGTDCPKCKKGKLVLRKGIYGSFFACENYPKCKYTVSEKKS